MVTLAVVTVICVAAYFITTIICTAYTTGKTLKNSSADLTKSVDSLKDSVDKLKARTS